MKREGYQKVKKIFQSAVELVPEKRADFLNQECGVNKKLRQEVERLLEAEDSKFLEEPAMKEFAEVIADENENDPTKIFNDIQTNKQFGHFKIIKQIGIGGMGEVFLADDISLDRQVAVKFLSHEFSRDSDKLNRFIQEAKAASALNHPNILTIYEVGQTDGKKYIASEFIEGKTLRDVLEQKDLIPLNTILKITIQIAEALSTAHDAGIIHRDIKPENIMVRDDGYVKVLDFGLAKLTEVKTEEVESEGETNILVKTDTGLVMGTASYMSPEQARGIKVDERTDIFSFGVLMYELLTGKLPFEGETTSDLLVAILEKEPVPLTRYAPDTPSELQQMIAKAIRKDKDERYQTMKSLLADLKTLKSELEFSEKLERTESPDSGNGIETKEVGKETSETSPAQKTIATTSKYRNLLKNRVVSVPALLGLVITSVLVGYYFYSNSATPPVLTDKDVILVTDFENKTGEEIFDGILKEGLTIALQQSPFLSIFPDSKAHETLKLMKRNPEKPITRELGRDICQREGIKAYIVGTITKLGSIYVLGLEAVNGQTGQRIVLTQTQAGANDQKNVLAAISKAATEMRKKLGEPLAQIAKSDKSLEEVTTSSLEAFEAFTMARESERRNDLSEWILHSRRAIKIDPSFAMAYKGLAVAYFNLDEYTLAKEADRKAYELRERLSERERLWVIAGHYRWTEEVDKHIATLKLLKSKYPREPDAMNDLGLEYKLIGDYEKALEEFRLAVNTPPKDLIIFGNLVKAYMHLNRYEEAKKAVEKAVKNGFERHEFEYLLYLLAFTNDDEAEMQRVVELNNGKIHPWLRIYLTAFSGQWQQSMKFYRQITLQSQETKERQAARNAFRAMTAAEIGQCSQAQSLANESIKRFRSSFLTWRATFAFARCGNISRTQSLINEIQEKYPDSTYYNGFGIPIYKAMIELNKDNPKEAIKLLETVRRYESGSFYWVQTVRGEAYLKLNENEKARIEFQTILDHRGWYPLSPLYPLAQLGKARAMKDKREYEKFFEMWKDADKDLPALIAAKKEYAELK